MQSYISRYVVRECVPQFVTFVVCHINEEGPSMWYLATVLLFVLPEHRKEPTFNVCSLYGLITSTSLK